MTNSCWSPLSNSFLWRRRETAALWRHLTFLYSLTIEALKAFHLWSFRGKKSESLDSFYNQYSIFIFQVQSNLANMPSLCIFPSEPFLPTIISTDILCANAVIDTFITSKEIQFSFQSSTGMNSATSSPANNERPLPWAKGRLHFLSLFKGKSMSNSFLKPTFVLGK